ncbi:hydroxyacylglutathione hydrolase [Silvanigrella aquatica]|uniref:Hydroxyacylglutathione hydrolase n=1 Tax=Silvanigrella aquatica TaxID=1915309 RepID=A0A1L4D423_9BACT|nr:hydroxyacylglutathione hydrolase [Silvanigrella aquatica]APJ04964.1 hydroxyacylglutathione hydrolase [Silvanigrella aquatica]
MEIRMLPVLNDNYIFILIDELKQEAAVVDPALAEPVLKFLKSNKLKLTKIFNTHHHFDHVSGNKELSRAFPNVEVYGGINDAERIPGQTHYLKQGDLVAFAAETATVFFVPGHTVGHICYYFPLKNGEHHLFVGDTLFSGGCGKLFEGTMQQMFASLKFLRDFLPNETLIWCAHEYTVENYLILNKLEPDNLAITTKLNEAIEARKKNQFTVPFSLKSEKEISSFLRWDDPELKAKLNLSTDFEVFSYVRKYRDNPPKVTSPI